jgi:hypothetical protein
MAKACMRPYYALGLLVAGIVLLYLFVYNVEPFIQVPTFNKKQITLAPGSKQVSIYLHQASNGSIKFISATDRSFSTKNVICTMNKCTINMSNTLNDYAIYGYQNNCKQCITNISGNKACPADKLLEYATDQPSKCWNLAYSGVALLINGKEFPSKVVSKILSTRASFNTLPQKFTSLSITGLSVGNLQTKPLNIDKNGANICIDLSIS